LHFPRRSDPDFGLDWIASLSLAMMMWTAPP